MVRMEFDSYWHNGLGISREARIVERKGCMGFFWACVRDVMTILVASTES